MIVKAPWPPRILLMLGLAEILMVSSASAQPLRSIDLDTYHHLLDTLFAVQHRPPPPAIFEISIRVVPSFGPESQVNLMLLSDQTTVAEVVVADENVHYHSEKILSATGDAGIETLAKRNTVKRYSVNVSPTLLLEWQRGLLKSLHETIGALANPHVSNKVTLDGEAYELLYRQYPTDIHVAIDNPGTDSALFTWAKAVNSAVAKQAPGAAHQKAN